MKFLPLATFLIGFLFPLAFCAPARAQSDYSPVQNYQTPCFAKIPQLAKRLHVGSGATPGGLAVRGCDGKSYDLVALISALLDRIDKQDKKLNGKP